MSDVKNSNEGGAFGLDEAQTVIIKLIAEKKKLESNLTKTKHVAKKLLQQKQKHDSELKLLKQENVQYKQQMVDEKQFFEQLQVQYKELKQRFSAIQNELQQKIQIESNAKLIEEGTNNYSSELIEELTSENASLRIQLDKIKQNQEAEINKLKTIISRLEMESETKDMTSVSIQEHERVITEYKTNHDSVEDQMNDLAAKYDQLIENQAELMIKHSEEMSEEDELKKVVSELKADNEKLIKHIVKMTNVADAEKAKTAKKMKNIFMGSLIIGTAVYWLNGKRKSRKNI